MLMYDLVVSTYINYFSFIFLFRRWWIIDVTRITQVLLRHSVFNLSSLSSSKFTFKLIFFLTRRCEASVNSLLWSSALSSTTQLSILFQKTTIYSLFFFSRCLTVLQRTVFSFSPLLDKSLSIFIKSFCTVYSNFCPKFKSFLCWIQIAWYIEIYNKTKLFSPSLVMLLSSLFEVSVI